VIRHGQSAWGSTPGGKGPKEILRHYSRPPSGFLYGDALSVTCDSDGASRFLYGGGDWPDGHVRMPTHGHAESAVVCLGRFGPAGRGHNG